MQQNRSDKKLNYNAMQYVYRKKHYVYRGGAAKKDCGPKLASTSLNSPTSERMELKHCPICIDTVKCTRCSLRSI